LKPSDTARVQEVTDSEPATVVAIEPLNVRRGGRGRGRKGMAAKETMQVYVQWCKDLTVSREMKDSRVGEGGGKEILFRVHSVLRVPVM